MFFFFLPFVVVVVAMLQILVAIVVAEVCLFVVSFAVLSFGNAVGCPHTGLWTLDSGLWRHAELLSKTVYIYVCIYTLVYVWVFEYV